MIAAMHGLFCWAGALGAAACLMATVAFAQPANAPAIPADPPQIITAPPPAPQTSAPLLPERLPTPQETFGAIGRAIDQSLQSLGAGVSAGVRGTAETLGATTGAAGDLAKGVGDAAGTVARLPGTNAVSGREVCPIAPNGAPDCASAALALCRTKGFERGNSLDITSSHKCPPQMWREGRAPNPQECTDESFVSRALCQ